MDSRNDFDVMYKKGYGIQFPESHVVRSVGRILDYQLGIRGQKGESMFDFGCGNGTHCVYFASMGYQVSGVDVASQAVDEAKRRLPEASFFCIKPAESLLKYYPQESFDVILANQTLYYLNDQDLTRTIEELYRLTKPGGVILASMMGRKNYYFDCATGKENKGLIHIKVGGRVNAESWINFMPSKQAVINLFKPFKRLHLGWYDFILRDDEGSQFHYWYAGQKI